MGSEKRLLLYVWLVVAAALGICLAAASLDRRPLDDPDLVFQRPGFLDAHGPPFPAPKVGDELPERGRRLVVFFLRPEQLEDLKAALASNLDLSRNTSLAAAVSGPLAERRSGGVLWLADPTGNLAGGFHMPQPRDGGPPVGYAVVDRNGLVRYHTLDPTMAERLDEVETIVRATP